METNELELNRWAHEQLLGEGCLHDWQPDHCPVRSCKGKVHWAKCSKCGSLDSADSEIREALPAYTESLDLAAKVEAKAIDLVGWLKYSEAIWDLLIAEVSFRILRWPEIMRRYTTLPALTRVQAAKRAVEGGI